MKTPTYDIIRANSVFSDGCYGYRLESAPGVYEIWNGYDELDEQFGLLHVSPSFERMVMVQMLSIEEPGSYIQYSNAATLPENSTTTSIEWNKSGAAMTLVESRTRSYSLNVPIKEYPNSMILDP
jgi:hypothetical protein